MSVRITLKTGIRTSPTDFTAGQNAVEVFVSVISMFVRGPVLLLP
jgi:hypothetical protein